jgi:hypothetical protein
LLFRDGFANAMGHNLDFRGCADRAIRSYERLIELQPENRIAHFYLGGFLATPPRTRMMASSICGRRWRLV